MQHSPAELTRVVPRWEFLGLLEWRRKQHAGIVRLSIFSRPFGDGPDHARVAQSPQPEAIAGAIVVRAHQTFIGALPADDTR